MLNQLSDKDVKSWFRGNYCRAYQFLGATPTDGGTHFAVWAPNARAVRVVGDFNGWIGDRHSLTKDSTTGIWYIFVEGVSPGELYKYQIEDADGNLFLKSDPYAFAMEEPPDTASIVSDREQFLWDDDNWMRDRQTLQAESQPIAIYEVHLQSWRRKKDGSYLTYRELAAELIPYVKNCGFTHIELLPVAEHPHDPSWGYQITGYFAPTRRLGNPSDFKYFINECHNYGLGVIMDWVPAHFPKDENGLILFDGTALYGHDDPTRREQKDWGTLAFDYEKPGVRNFLFSNAHYWCEQFHIDGLRVDAVASMLYLDYSKGPGEWTPNKDGGNENYAAINFLQDLNSLIHDNFPGVLTFAEESTAWKGVTHPATEGGLGFDYKWNMGWMNDTLEYIEKDFEERKKYLQKITFSITYNDTERFLLPLSHDEVVHLKKPLLKKSSGTETHQFANLRLLLSYQYTHPGKKLLFMGGEIAETREWAEDRSLQWHLLQKNEHIGIQKLIQDLNHLYTSEAALYEKDKEREGFEWVAIEKNPPLIGFKRLALNEPRLLVFLNFSPKMAEYHKQLNLNHEYQLIFNSNSVYYGGNNKGHGYLNEGEMQLQMAPFSALIFKAISTKK